MSTTAITAKTEYPHIVKTPGTMGGESRLDGHRIRVRDVVAMRDIHGHTPQQIVDLDYPQLTLSQVYSAFAYYEDHRQEIDEYARREADFVEQIKRDHFHLTAADLTAL
jgi:uncharacterized protein (DUF433 family)